MAASDAPDLDEMDLKRLERELAQAKDYEELKRVIVEAPFEQPLAVASLFLCFVVLMTANEKTGVIDRVAITDTELARNTFEVTAVAFEDIKIPLHHPDNILAQTLDDGKPRDTTDWYYTFTPAMTGDQARINQASAGAAYTAVYRLDIPHGGGILSFSYYQYASSIGEQQRKFMSGYAKIVSKAMTKLMSKNSSH